MKLSDLIKKARKIVVSEVTDDEIIYYLNKAQDDLNRICVMPDCHKICKNFKGLRIHMAKKHGFKNKFRKANCI